MRRVTALVLAIIFSIAIMLPLVDSSAHRNNRSSMSRRHRGHRHSRAWWRRHRARMHRRRAALARRRALVASQREHKLDLPADIERPVLTNASPVAERVTANDSRGSANLLQPERRSTTPVTVNGQTQFRLYAQGGQLVGQAQLAVVNAVPSDVSAMNSRTQRRQLAGVPFTQLRHQVIEKMIAGNGWVINDMEREINGRRVFVVVAQTAVASDGQTPAQTWSFYFLELDGRIYSLTAHAPVEMMEQMAAESEKVIATLPTSNRSVIAEKALR
jgi:hypothetical protein